MAESPSDPPADRLATLLRRSLRHLAVEVPDSYRHLVAEVGSLVVEVTSGTDAPAETFTMYADGPGIVVADGPAAVAGPRIGTSRATILALVDAEMGLAEAVESAALSVRGSVDDVLRAHDALLAYVHAAVRAPSAPGLLSALRGGAGEVR